MTTDTQLQARVAELEAALRDVLVYVDIAEKQVPPGLYRLHIFSARAALKKEHHG